VGRFLSGLFGGGVKSPPAFSLRVTSALQGVPIPILLGGQQRMPCSLVWYGDFQWRNSKSGGKGGPGGGGGASNKGESGSYDYSASFIAAICEGTVESTGSYYVNGSITPMVPGMGFVDGTYSQDPWTVPESSQQLAYRGIACGLAGSYSLGSSPSMPNLNFEVVSTNCNAIAGAPDADPSVCWNIFLTNEYFGVGFPSALMASLDATASSWSNFCLAYGMVVSPVLASQTTAASFLDDLLTATCATACWQDGQLNVIPYCDTALNSGTIETATEPHLIPPPTNPAADGSGYSYITINFPGQFVADLGVTNSALTVFPNASAPPGEGQYWMQTTGTYVFNYEDAGTEVEITYQYAATTSYVPQTSNFYDFSFDDYLDNQSTIGAGLLEQDSPLLVVRTPRDQVYNSIKVEYLDRSNNYNPCDIEIKDEASITAFGRYRPSDTKQLHMFCLEQAAHRSAVFQLLRQQILRTFQWTVGSHFLMFLSLMDVVTVTDAGQGLDEQPVRIIEIQENQDFSVTLTAEEYLGTVGAPIYGSQINQGHNPNYNQPPGPINSPLLFEPTFELGGGLEVWGAVCGDDDATWGGCQVWVSYDNVNYAEIATINGGARMGVTTADLPAVPVNAAGLTIDQANTLAVNLSESDGALSSASLDDALLLATRCYVGGEIIAYRTATLTGLNEYDLTYLVRGAFDTDPQVVDHPSGTPFARLDSGIFGYGYDASKIGSTIYLKFPSFNAYGGGLQELSAVPYYTYAISGSALSAPLPDVTNLSAVYVDGFANLTWTEVTDFRDVEYQIRLGASWLTGVNLGQVAHPPFPTRGNGTFWVAAVSTPTAGLTVYSEDPASIVITGNLLTTNVLASEDEAPSWPGVLGGAAVKVGAVIQSAGNGTYTIPYDQVVDLGRIAPCPISISWVAEGVLTDDNILSLANILTSSDILGLAPTSSIDAYPQIQVGVPSSDDDIYSGDDAYASPNAYAPISWGGWQPYVPGTYNGRYFIPQLVLETLTEDVICEASSFSFVVDAPTRIDHVTQMALPSGGSAFIFTPDGSSTAAPFNGGPNGAILPLVHVTIMNQASGDFLAVSGETLAGVTLQIMNGASGVARTINATFEGY
jgi:hypothetical protein